MLAEQSIGSNGSAMHSLQVCNSHQHVHCGVYTGSILPLTSACFHPSVSRCIPRGGSKHRSHFCHQPVRLQQSCRSGPFPGFKIPTRRCYSLATYNYQRLRPFEPPPALPFAPALPFLAFNAFPFLFVSTCVGPSAI